MYKFRRRHEFWEADGGWGSEFLGDIAMEEEQFVIDRRDVVTNQAGAHTQAKHHLDQCSFWNVEQGRLDLGCLVELQQLWLFRAEEAENSTAVARCAAKVADPNVEGIDPDGFGRETAV